MAEFICKIQSASGLISLLMTCGQRATKVPCNEAVSVWSVYITNLKKIIFPELKTHYSNNCPSNFVTGSLLLCEVVHINIMKTGYQYHPVAHIICGLTGWMSVFLNSTQECGKRYFEIFIKQITGAHHSASITADDCQIWLISVPYVEVFKYEFPTSKLYLR